LQDGLASSQAQHRVGLYTARPCEQVQLSLMGGSHCVK
jgi:hypothetical protein